MSPTPLDSRLDRLPRLQQHERLVPGTLCFGAEVLFGVLRGSEPHAAEVVSWRAPQDGPPRVHARVVFAAPSGSELRPSPDGRWVLWVVQRVMNLDFTTVSLVEAGDGPPVELLQLQGLGAGEAFVPRLGWLDARHFWFEAPLWRSWRERQAAPGERRATYLHDLAAQSVVAHFADGRVPAVPAVTPPAADVALALLRLQQTDAARAVLAATGGDPQLSALLASQESERLPPRLGRGPPRGEARAPARGHRPRRRLARPAPGALRVASRGGRVRRAPRRGGRVADAAARRRGRAGAAGHRAGAAGPQG